MSIDAKSILIVRKRFASLLKTRTYKNHPSQIFSFDRKGSSSSFISLRCMKIHHQFINIESKPFQSILAKSFV